MRLPSTDTQFAKAWPKFKAWLVERGSAVISTTNAYECARFLTDRGIGIVYKNGAGKVTSWANGADDAWRAWKTGTSWRAVERVKRGTAKGRRDYATLAERDGPRCVFCDCGLSVDTATIEHIVPLSAGGPDHLANKALACRSCNQAAGSLPASQKIRLALSKRGTVAA